jgi:hypothetical protein
MHRLLYLSRTRTLNRQLLAPRATTPNPLINKKIYQLLQLIWVDRTIELKKNTNMTTDVAKTGRKTSNVEKGKCVDGELTISIQVVF